MYMRFEGKRTTTLSFFGLVTAWVSSDQAAHTALFDSIGRFG